MSETTPAEVTVTDHFATAAKDISHVTFYFGSGDLESGDFYFVKVETPDSVNDDLDNWYQAAVDEMMARDPNLANYELMGAAIKYGNFRSGGGEVYFSLDGDPTDEDYAPTGGLVPGREFKFYDGGTTYNYADLF